MRTKDLVELFVLAAIWGLSFLFMRTATPEFGAIALVAVRTGIAFVFLLPILVFARKVPAVLTYWKPILVVGVINTALPFCLFSYSTVQLGAGFAAILNATAPMFGALIAYLWLRERLTNLAVLGLITGFVGVVVISNARASGSIYLSILPVLAALGATASYGFAVCFTRRFLTGVDTLAIATGSQLFACLVLVPLALVTWPADFPSTNAWVQVGFLGVISTGFAYILYFRLIANIGASRALSVAYLVPIFGVIWGMVFLSEQITAEIMSGAALIFLGVALTTGVIRRRRTVVP